MTSWTMLASPEAKIFVFISFLYLVIIYPGLLLITLDPGKQLGDVILATLLRVLQPLGDLHIETSLTLH